MRGRASSSPAPTAASAPGRSPSSSHEGTPVVAFDASDDDHRLRLVLDDDELAALARVRGDITDLAALERTLDEHGITHVIHLAALQVPFCRADPPLGARVNVVGTVNVFEAVARRADRMGPVVYARPSPPTTRSTSGAGRRRWRASPSTLYGVFKRANEGTATVFAAERGVAQRRPAPAHRLRRRARPGPHLRADHRDAPRRRGPALRAAVRRRLPAPVRARTWPRLHPGGARAARGRHRARHRRPVSHTDDVIEAIDRGRARAREITYDRVVLPFPADTGDPTPATPLARASPTRSRASATCSTAGSSQARGPSVS